MEIVPNSKSTLSQIVVMRNFKKAINKHIRQLSTKWRQLYQL